MHPRQAIREAVATRIGQVVSVVDDAVRPADYDYQLVEGDDGYIAPVLRNVYWTPADDRVFSTRSSELTPEDLPCIVVQAPEERIEMVNTSDFDGGYRRTLALHVEGIAEALDDVEDTLDDLAEGIEGALDGLLIENQEQAHLRLTRTEMDVDRSGELPIGAVRVTYEVIYTSYRLGVDLGLWDRDYPDNCPALPLTSVILRSHVPQGSVDYETMEVL